VEASNKGHCIRQEIMAKWAFDVFLKPGQIIIIAVTAGGCFIISMIYYHTH
jgi:hypothetical protein